jgi:hypothetical protein
MKILLDQANAKVCGCGKTPYCNRIQFELPKAERGTYIGIYVLFTLMLRYIIPIVIGLVVVPDVGMYYLSYPFVTLVAYAPVYAETANIALLVLNIVIVVIFYLFAFYCIGFHSLPPIFIAIIGALLTLPFMGSFQVIGLIINGILNVIPWELGMVTAFLKKDQCPLPVKIAPTTPVTPPK